jgi:cytochrome c-type biogenesis protein CcmH
MRRQLALVLLALALAAPGALSATNPDEMLADPALEQRARDLGKELRCLVCQNQSIDDSDAGLARDLRRIVRERLLAGDRDAEILEFLTARYGEFVLLKPPVEPATWGLWFGPFLVLVVAGLGAVLYLRRTRTSTSRAAPLSTDEQARLQALLDEEAKPSH